MLVLQWGYSLYLQLGLHILATYVHYSTSTWDFSAFCYRSFGLLIQTCTEHYCELQALGWTLSLQCADAL